MTTSSALVSPKDNDRRNCELSYRPGSSRSTYHLWNLLRGPGRQRSSNIGSGPNFVKSIARLLTVVAYFGDGAFAGGTTGCEPDQVACEWMLARGCASPTPLVQHVETLKRPVNFRAFVHLM